MNKFLEVLNSDSNQLIELLHMDSPIPEIKFNPLIGQFTHHLNELLRYYAEQDSNQKDILRPYVNYYRQVQNYLAFLLRFSSILCIPHHSEIQQTLNLLENRDLLLKTTYYEISNAEKELFQGNFYKHLNDLYEKRK